jgi:hypothetical protein
VLRLCALALLLAITFPCDGRGQTSGGVTDGNIDLGGALLRQPGLATTNVLTAAGQVRYLTNVSELVAAGVGAMTPEDRFTGQALLSASRYAPATERWRWEVAGAGSAFGLSGESPAFGWQLLAREHLTSSLGGVFVGAGGGQVIRESIARRVITGHTGGYLRIGALGQDELSGAIAYTDAGTVKADSGSLRYGEALAFWKHRTGPLELLAGGGLRLTQGHSGASSWGSASAAFSITQRTTVVLAVGRALEDVSRAVPSVRYLSVSVRLGFPTSATPSFQGVRRALPDEDGGRLEVRVSDDSVRLVSIHVRSATNVELMADFTDWEPVQMSQEPNGMWTLKRVIEPGPHRVAIRVNSGAWGAPPNLPRIADDFGGEVGLLVVP